MDSYFHARNTETLFDVRANGRSTFLDYPGQRSESAWATVHEEKVDVG